jgi:hypothetical protein
MICRRRPACFCTRPYFISHVPRPTRSLRDTSPKPPPITAPAIAAGVRRSGSPALRGIGWP